MNTSLISVTLIAAHTHEGKTCAPGESIEVDHTTAQWLKQHGIALAADEASVTSDSATYFPTSKPTKVTK